MTRIAQSTALPLIALAAMTLAGCELGPKQSEQTGYRGSGGAQITDASNYVAPGDVPPPPYDLPAPGGETAAQAYQNVQVLGGVSREEFDYTMAAITQWIAPEQGCNYCHNPENLADDGLYTKVVARRMIQMTQNLNQNWTAHVKQTGVTCYTCHRGNAVPQYVWNDLPKGQAYTIRGNKRGQNTPDPSVAYASLPLGNFSMYLGPDAQQARIQSATLHPTTANPTGTRQAENVYGMMMHLSQALGVNCTYCHNTQSFRAWGLSSPQRAQAWYGLRMARNINQDYITPLATVFPDNRLGPSGDPYKVNCATCHQQQRKPLGGVSMVKDYPALQHATYVPQPAAPAPTESAAPAEAVE